MKTTKTKRKGRIKSLAEILKRVREPEIDHEAFYKSAFPESPKPTTLLDVWGTDVEEVILSDGRHLKMTGKRFTPNGEYWYNGRHSRWEKSAETHVSYLFPPEFKEEKPSLQDRKDFLSNHDIAPVKSPSSECAIERLKKADLETEDAIRDIAYQQMKERITNGYEKKHASSWLVRLDNWIKRLSRK